MREKGPLLVYSHDGREGGLRPPVHTLWGEFYEAFPRDPHDVSAPSWRVILRVWCVCACMRACLRCILCVGTDRVNVILFEYVTTESG